MVETKVCTKCKVDKCITAFSKDKQKKDGLRSSCKECEAISKKANYNKYKERSLAYSKEWRKANTQHLYEYHKEWLNLGGRETRKTYVENNRERIRLLKNNAQTKRNRLLSKTELTGVEYANWVSEQPKICSYCGNTCYDVYHVDHIDALHNGGTHSLDNLTITCVSCNLSKGTFPLLTWFAKTKKEQIRQVRGK
jgi:5-methylcytosine-specific restriction endonuclease McrA